MNRVKHYFYDKHIVKHPTMKMWLNTYKPLFELGFDRYFRGEYRPKRGRHRRSIAIRKLKLLLSWDEKSFEELNCWCEHGVTCKQVKKHRILVYTY